MGRQKRTNQEWLEYQIEKICDLGKRVGSIKSETSLTYGAHTAVKLAALNHCLEVFLTNARKYIDQYGWFDSAIYIDLFAGCGATRVTDTKDWLAGSPVLAAGSPLTFDKIVCIEKNQNYCDALQARLAIVSEINPIIIPGDCNRMVYNLQDKIDCKKPLAFVFVDPEGMQTEWKTLEALSEQFPRMDLLLNFPFGAERVLGDLRSGRDISQRVMEAFAGKDWPMLLFYEEARAVDFIESKMSTVLGKPVGDKVLIRDKENRRKYFLLVRVRQTEGGSSFFNGYKDMLRRVNGLKPKDVLGVLNKKFQRSLEAFGQSM